MAAKRAQLELLHATAARKEQLAEQGTASRNDADEAHLRVSEVEVELAGLQSLLRHARVRRQAADGGVFMTEAGADPAWVFQDRMDLKLAKKDARLALRRAESDLAMAELMVSAAESDFRRLSRADVTAPPGSILWSRRVAQGSTVRAGEPVAEALDCSVLLVDVPIRDVELPLVRPGMEVEVLLDGDLVPREGRVLLTRGSASILNRNDLAAVARGRDPAEAQVVIDLSAEAGSFAACPVGRAAAVDFPEIGLFDVIAAWLRL